MSTCNRANKTRVLYSAPKSHSNAPSTPTDWGGEGRGREREKKKKERSSL